MCLLAPCWRTKHLTPTGCSPGWMPAEQQQASPQGQPQTPEGLRQPQSGRTVGEDLDKGIEGRAVAAVLHSHPWLQLGQEGFDAGSLSRQQLVQQGEEVGSSWCGDCQCAGGDPLPSPQPRSSTRSPGCRSKSPIKSRPSSGDISSPAPMALGIPTLLVSAHGDLLRCQALQRVSGFPAQPPIQ